MIDLHDLARIIRINQLRTSEVTDALADTADLDHDHEERQRELDLAAERGA